MGAARDETGRLFTINRTLYLLTDLAQKLTIL
jgi:hypothetical protein